MRKAKALGTKAFTREQRHETPVNRRGGLSRELLVNDGLGERLKRTLQLLHPQAIRSRPLNKGRKLWIGGVQLADHSVVVYHALCLCASRCYGYGWIRTNET